MPPSGETRTRSALLRKRPRRAVKPQHAKADGPRRRAHAASSDLLDVIYREGAAIDRVIVQIRRAKPLEMVEIQRRGLPGQLVKDLARSMDIPAIRMFDIMRVPKATAEKKAAAGEMVSGSEGQAAIAMARLIGIAQEIAESSATVASRDFDAAKWLGQWLERPQAALGGRKPAALLDTPTGVEIVTRLLGAIESGAYQ